MARGLLSSTSAGHIFCEGLGENDVLKIVYYEKTAISPLIMVQITPTQHQNKHKPSVHAVAHSCVQYGSFLHFFCTLVKTGRMKILYYEKTAISQEIMVVETSN
jgi:hypothetical protein